MMSTKLKVQGRLNEIRQGGEVVLASSSGRESYGGCLRGPSDVEVIK